MNTRVRGRRAFVTVASAVLGLAVAVPLASAGPASAATTHHSSERATAQWKHHSPAAHLSGTTTVTTAPGIATALLGAGVLPLPTRDTKIRIGSFSPLTVSYGFAITGGKPNLAGPSGDILHSGGISFVSRKAKLEIGRFDIDLAAGKVFARQINYAPGRIAVLDLDLSGLKVSTAGKATVLSGIKVRLDPAAAGALNATFGLALPADGSLVFGSARVVLNG